MKDKDFLKFVEDSEKLRKQFWDIDYPKLNTEEKIKIWTEATYYGMRTQGEVLADKYSEFSKGWYDFAKEVEPDFDAIFKEVVKKLGFEFNWSEYYIRIKG